jgi:ParB family chromosome partitioning protein
VRPIRDIEIADIKVGDRLRPLNAARVALLADSFSRLQQIAPIEVSDAGNGKWLLVAGWHRLAAAKAAGLTKIEARVFSGNADQRRLREIEENLVRHDLNALDRAVAIEHWFQLFGALNSPKKGSPTEKNLANQCVAEIAKRFDLAVADRAGLSARTIRDDLALLRKLGADREMVAALPIAENRAELARLARMSPKERKPIIAGLRQGKSFKELTASKAKAEVKDKHLNALVLAWKAAPKAAKQAFIRTFNSEIADLLNSKASR